MKKITYGIAIGKAKGADQMPDNMEDMYDDMEMPNAGSYGEYSGKIPSSVKGKVPSNISPDNIPSGNMPSGASSVHPSLAHCDNIAEVVDD